MKGRWVSAPVALLLCGLVACTSQTPSAVPSTGGSANTRAIDKTAACAEFKTLLADHESKVLPDLLKLAQRREQSEVDQLKAAVNKNSEQHAAKVKELASAVSDQGLGKMIGAYGQDLDRMGVYVTALVPGYIAGGENRGVESGLPGEIPADLVKKQCDGSVTRSKALACYEYFFLSRAVNDLPKYLEAIQNVDRQQGLTFQANGNKLLDTVIKYVTQLSDQSTDAELKAALLNDAKYFEGYRPIVAIAVDQPDKVISALQKLPAPTGTKKICGF